jgi:FlaA1/EpsC-like NDP-sugar epimerase
MEFLEMRIKLKNFLIFPLLMMMWSFVFSRYRLYDSRRLATLREDVIDILKATAPGTLGIVMLGIVFRIDLITPRFVAVFFASSSVLTVLYRVSLKFTLRKVRLWGRNLRFIVFIGTNPRAIRVAGNMTANPHFGYRVLGFADDAWTGMDAFLKTGYPLVSDLAGLPDFLRKHVVDEVFVCLPLKTRYEGRRGSSTFARNRGSSSGSFPTSSIAAPPVP